MQLQARTLTLIRRKGVPVRSRRLRSKYVYAFSVIISCSLELLSDLPRFALPGFSGCRLVSLKSLAIAHVWLLRAPFGVACPRLWRARALPPSSHRAIRHVACGTASFETAEAYAITLACCSGPNAKRPSTHGRLVVDAAYFLRGSEPRPRLPRGGRGVGRLHCAPRERGERLRFGAHSVCLAQRQSMAQRATSTHLRTCCSSRRRRQHTPLPSLRESVGRWEGGRMEHRLT